MSKTMKTYLTEIVNFLALAAVMGAGYLVLVMFFAM